MIKYLKCIIDESRCVDCGFCSMVNICYSKHIGCTGCLSCYYSCPYEARRIVNVEENRREITIYIEGKPFKVPEKITVKKALELYGIKFSRILTKTHSNRIILAPCGTGGCWSCAVIINGELERSCITPVEEDMSISLNVENVKPLRIVHGPEPHPVGGKATPWFEKGKGRYIEVAIWVSGCNLRCPTCQNYHVTYDNISAPMTPEEAAKILTYYRRLYGVRGLAISGGEPTINRRWLVEYFKWLRKLNPDDKARLHLDSNGTFLTPDYIDELVEAGCNNIGVEPKALNLETFMRITGLRDREIAKIYLENSWNAIKYIVDHYKDQVYLGVGFIYNRKLISLEEIAKMGEKLAKIDPEIQVCVLDYFPAFRRRDIVRPSVKEMLQVKKILNDIGLKYVIVQTRIGHIGP